MAHKLQEYEIAVQQIMHQTGCCRTDAIKTIRLVDEFVRDARRCGYEGQYPTHRQLASRECQLYKQVIPLGRTEPGSAHEALERLLLSPELGEQNLRRIEFSGLLVEIYILAGATK